MHFCKMRMSGVATLAQKKRVATATDCSERLQQRLLLFSFANLFITSCLGVLLRSLPYLHSFPLDYKNILHGHSHFAFGGWIMPVLLALVMKSFTELRKAVAYRHWRNIAVLMLASAYGMLMSFPLQGYKAVSISFSTLSLVAGFYLAIMIWTGSRRIASSVSQKFLNAALFYHVVSSIGPFATAPLIIMGKSGTPLYFDVIYFFLHFQYNGFFTFVVIALIYKMLERQKVSIHSGQKVLLLLNTACIPAYFLSVLWHEPSIIFNILGGLAAALQVVALAYFIKDASRLQWKQHFFQWVFTLSLGAFILKNILQLLSALPVVASVSYEYRNFVIAYLHLVLLGFISMFVFAATFQNFTIKTTKRLGLGLLLFLVAFISTELLLVLSAAAGLWNFSFPGLTTSLFMCSILFPMGLLMLYLTMKPQLAALSDVK